MAQYLHHATVVIASIGAVSLVIAASGVFWCARILERITNGDDVIYMQQQ